MSNSNSILQETERCFHFRMFHKHSLKSSRRRIESCTSQLLSSWRPFHRLSLADEDNDRGGKKTSDSNYNKSGSFRLEARKRRRRNSRLVSGRSRDRSGTRRCCSDFPFAVSSDSSGELFGEQNWASDVIDAARNSGREKEAPEFGLSIGIDPMGNESGYGSDPGYRGDAEFGYNGEDDDDDEDVKPRFWEDTDSTRQMSGVTKCSDSKPQFRCRRRRQHDYKTVDPMR